MTGRAALAVAVRRALPTMWPALVLLLSTGVGFVKCQPSPLRTEVDNVTALVAAIDGAAAHIVITADMDLSSDPRSQSGLDIEAGTQSIRVRRCKLL